LIVKNSIYDDGDQAALDDKKINRITNETTRADDMNPPLLGGVEFVHRDKAWACTQAALDDSTTRQCELAVVTLAGCKPCYTGEPLGSTDL
jgi:hypothetical protein